MQCAKPVFFRPLNRGVYTKDKDYQERPVPLGDFIANHLFIDPAVREIPAEDPLQPYIINGAGIEEKDHPGLHEHRRRIGLGLCGAGLFTEFAGKFRPLKGNLQGMFIGKCGCNIRALSDHISFVLGFDILVRFFTTDELSRVSDLYVCYNGELTDDEANLIVLFVSHEISRILKNCSYTSGGFSHEELVSLYTECADEDFDLDEVMEALDEDIRGRVDAENEFMEGMDAFAENMTNPDFWLEIFNVRQPVEIDERCNEDGSGLVKTFERNGILYGV